MRPVIPIHRGVLPLFLSILPFGQTASWAQATMSEIKSDERVVFFPTAARLSDDGQAWIVPIHGWIFEPEEGDRLRAAAMRQLRELVDLPADHSSTTVFEGRLRAYLVDNERGKRVGIRIAGRQHVLPASAADGHFTATVELPAALVKEQSTNGRLKFRAVTAAGDRREFFGVAHCVSPNGISVISDIDDTIKITNVRDKKELIENTFFREFRAVDGMAAVYRRWADAGAQFHFVSSSPWQLYEPLARFTHDAAFPAGTFHLKPFRMQDSSVLGMLVSSIDFKLSVIEPLLQGFPARTFILVGDSGEKDPEIYGGVARRFPKQVLRIYIRDVTGEPADAPRYQDAFRDVPTDTWQLFNDPATLSWPGRPSTR
jgi:phosphatidate phosphatase APP1